MRRSLAAVVVAAGLVFSLPPAQAATVARDHVARHDDDGDCQGGGCGGRSEEDSRYGSCRNFCPSFDKSPVQDSFNFDPQVCLPGATCYFEDRKKNQPQPKEQKPAAEPDLLCVVRSLPWHCDRPRAR